MDSVNLSLNYEHYSITDDTASYRLDTDTNTCQIAVSDPCNTTGSGFTTNSTECYTAGTLVGTTCYYDDDTDRSNDCTNDGCILHNCTINSGGGCHPTVGCVNTPTTLTATPLTNKTMVSE